MALNSALVWEIRSTGTYNGGSGFYVVTSDSVDYSQQDNPQATITDMTTGAAGVTVGSVSSAFTSAMVGNCMFCTGVGVTSGWYTIISVASFDAVVVDRTMGAGLTSVLGYVGGAYNPAISAVRNVLYNTNKANYNNMWIQSGTYDMTAITVVSYSILSTFYNKIFGYKTTRGDIVWGDDRPFFSFASANPSYSIVFKGSYQFIYGIRAESLLSTGAQTGWSTQGSTITFINCKATRLSYPESVALDGGDAHNFIACEAICSLGKGISMNDNGFIDNCYIHDCLEGVYLGDRCVASHCVIDGCASAAIVYSATNSKTHNNTIYNCGAAYKLDSYINIAYNNIIKDCVSVITGSRTGLVDLWALYNCDEGYTNGYTSFCTAGYGSISSDPLLADPANKDFSLISGSPCFNAAIAVGSNVGVITA